MTPRVLVTGAAGFVGRPAVAELRRRGFSVHGLGRHRLDAGLDAGLDAWHDVDLLDPAATDRGVRQVAPTHLLHLAWCTEHGTYWDDPANDAWADATLRLVDVATSAGCERVVVAGTCAQYDWSDDALAPDGVAHEDRTPRRPATRYGQAKERVTNAIGDSAAIGLVFFPYGPGEQPERLVPSVTRALLAGEPAPIGSGTQVRDFLHVDDCGAAFAALVDGAVTGAVNVGSGVGTSIADVAATIAREVGRPDLLRIGALADRPGDPPRLTADVGRLRDDVGFTPHFDLDHGVRNAVEWWRNERDRGVR